MWCYFVRSTTWLHQHISLCSTSLPYAPLPYICSPGTSDRSQLERIAPRFAPSLPSTSCSPQPQQQQPCRSRRNDSEPPVLLIHCAPSVGLHIAQAGAERGGHRSPEQHAHRHRHFSLSLSLSRCQIVRSSRCTNQRTEPSDATAKQAKMGILERIKEIEQEMDKTQRNKATEGHLGMLKARLAKLRSELLTPSSGGGGGQVIHDLSWCVFDCYAV